ncbi:bifunctional demethylmenaquinone methyltransferase/2-methoxy-6-polyprenyl-1,4-benzoquinol methylase UbiE [uncultured Porphyromonas sp.]|mgnify:FL=1|uniref:bifunctional demethylmenaquinone methyltransferase/2-methoxy-6-polyprenyl-1,4-benzoquinol methylase UbiE n=1 Tax=uncultured Porphyromonas sp. TaxID=159274 RepID=UPI0026029E89|nr:bifunctional demethylmenaquinone methyltransferase/2-methoxy-6-polyprenyl-1,4-benzoquinol methylase UbiE [uncultured Porphyromonas sp.]
MSVSLDGKSRYVRQMFDRIAGHYDSMNRLMTGGMDLAWRWQVIEHLADYAPHQVADLACGTGDMILMLSRYLPSVREIVGVDLSEGMLAVATERVKRATRAASVTLLAENCQELSLATQSVDAVTCTLGIRNFSDPLQGLREMHRILRPGGRLAILELSEPRGGLLLQGYNIYAKRLIPWIGQLCAHDRSAYSYLPASIQAMPQREKMTALIRKAGFGEVQYKEMPLGICVLYTAEA